MNSIESLGALLGAHKSGERIARDIAELLLDDDSTSFLLEKMEERKSALALLGQKLSALEQEALNIVEASDVSLTADQVAQKATKRSLKYRNHASTALKRLVQKGRIVQAGKNGQTILYSKKR